MSKESDDLKLAIQGQRAAIKGEQERLDRWLQDWALMASPLKVGDVTKGKGYTFTGRRVRVTEIGGKIGYSGKPEVWIRAVVLNKDGGDSKQHTHWDIEGL